MELPFDNPEAAKAFVAEQRALSVMHHQDLTHQMSEFLDSLDEHQIGVFDRLLVAASESDHFCGYVRGIIDILREQKFKICRCGVNHEAEAESAFPAKESDVGPVLSDEVENTPEEIEFLMAKYSVEAVPVDIQADYPTSLRCSVCFTPIVSLDDRMRRPHGTAGCSGCKTFEGQGVKWYGR